MIIEPGYNCNMNPDSPVEDHVSIQYKFFLPIFQLNILPKPLNPNPDSKWMTFFKDNEVLLQIDKDVR